MQPTALGRRSEDTQVGVFCEQLRRERASRRRKYAPRLPRPKTRPRGAAGQSGSPPRLCVRGTDNKYRVAKDGGPPTGRSATFAVCCVVGARPPPADAWHGVEECRLKVGPPQCGRGGYKAGPYFFRPVLIVVGFCAGVQSRARWEWVGAGGSRLCPGIRRIMAPFLGRFCWRWCAEAQVWCTGVQVAVSLVFPQGGEPDHRLAVRHPACPGATVASLDFPRLDK